MALWIRHSSGNDSKQHRAAPRRPSKLHCCTVFTEPREWLHGFFASLTIYELPLRVIYSGLMVLLFGAQTGRLGRSTGTVGWMVRREEKARVNLLNIAPRRHLQLRTWGGGWRGQVGSKSTGTRTNEQTTAELADKGLSTGHTVTV